MKSIEEIMAYTSVFGIISAKQIAGLAALIAAPMLMGATSSANVDVNLHGLRSDKGNILICITEAPDHFPNCSDDPNARHLKLPTVKAAHIAFNDLASGDYAVALIHDENANGKLDVAGIIPTEGVGFSRNPHLYFSAPKFKSADFAVTSGTVNQDIKMKYFL